MRAMVVAKPKQPLVLEQRPIPEPKRGEVRIRVHACGVCHSDQFVTEGLWPGLQFPRVTGHEVAGEIDAIGEGVDGFARGARVGVGWHGGHDGTCRNCQRGRFLQCEHAVITGFGADGGYAEYMIAPAVAVARMPDGMSFLEAAPLLCAGVTTFNALRRSELRGGDLVAVLGLGGLGHLGVQYARAMGFETVAIARGAEKEPFARQLGAHHYIDSEREDAAARLLQLGGARAVLATATSAAAIAPLVRGLGVGGSLLIVGAPLEPIPFGAPDLIGFERRIQGWASGSAIDSTDAMAFAQRANVKPMVEPFALEDARAALDRMLSGKARFRAVLDMAAR